MAPGPVEAARLIHTAVAVDAPPRSTRDILISIIINAGWCVKTDAEDKADLWFDRFVKRLERRIEESIEVGGYLPFCFNSSGSDYLQGSCFVEPLDTGDVADAKSKRSNTIRVADRCKLLTASDFERLGKKLLSLLKVKQPEVSRQSADQGIDFFGKLHFGDLVKTNFLNPGAEKHMDVWLVGQAKQYPETNVGTADIRELVGSIELARAKVYAGSRDPLEKLTVRLCDPIIYLFITTGRFSRDSLDLLAKSGVLAFDGEQIGQFLADHGVGIERGKFSEGLFDEWINEESS